VATLPVRLSGIRAVSLRQDAEASHTLHFNNLSFADVSHLQEMGMPASTLARDSRLTNFTTAPTAAEIDITFAAYIGQPYAYDDADLNAARGLAGGMRDRAYTIFGNRIEEFAHTNSQDVLVMQANAAGGGFARNNPASWGNMRDVLEATTANTIIIHTNHSPLNFTNQLERELFHQMVLGQTRLGRDVFVVSTSGNSHSITLVDGVRYINLPNFYIAGGEEGEMVANPSFAILRMRFGVDGARYSVETVFS
ncbi:MAG: hypothetical protein FWC69_06570, partial [Defluviitaleaceae bacterium]|nr:hypothetical protein [Defluviitaleaceae bacterium]